MVCKTPVITEIAHLTSSFKNVNHMMILRSQHVSEHPLINMKCSSKFPSIENGRIHSIDKVTDKLAVVRS